MARGPERGWRGVGTAARTHTPPPPLRLLSLFSLFLPFALSISSSPVLSLVHPSKPPPFFFRKLLSLCVLRLFAPLSALSFSSFLPLPSSSLPLPPLPSLSLSRSCLFCGLFSCRCHGDAMQTVQPPVCSAHVRSVCVCVCAADKSLRGSVYRIM